MNCAGTTPVTIESTSFPHPNVRRPDAVAFLHTERQNACEVLLNSRFAVDIDYDAPGSNTDRQWYVSHLVFKKDRQDLVIDAVFDCVDWGTEKSGIEPQTLASARIPVSLLMPSIRQLQQIVSEQADLTNRSLNKGLLTTAFQVDRTRAALHGDVWYALADALRDERQPIRFVLDHGDVLARRALAGALVIHILPPKFLMGPAPNLGSPLF